MNPSSDRNLLFGALAAQLVLCGGALVDRGEAVALLDHRREHSKPKRLGIIRGMEGIIALVIRLRIVTPR